MNNKYQEALQVMKSNNERIVDKARIFVDKYDENPFVVLQELVDKETPMKVTEIYTDEYYCPNCGNETLRFKYHAEYTHKYCLNCGQHLDWSEE